MLKKIIYVFLISIVPVIELRGAIPVGAGLDIPFYWNYLAAVVGNMLPVPFILLFIPAVLDFMKRHRIFPTLVGWIERKGMRGVEKIQARSGADSKDEEQVPCEEALPSEEATPEKAGRRRMRVTLGVCAGLFAFVAVPLPGTGAWTGALVASLCGLPKRYAIPTILLGVMAAGVIMSLASYGVVAAWGALAK